MPSTSILSFTGDQLAEVLHRARLIEDDAKRDAYFAQVADALRDMPTVNDNAMRQAAAAAFAPFAINRKAAQ